jgi:branched-chain amino acid transport system permease protein
MIDLTGRRGGEPTAPTKGATRGSVLALRLGRTAGLVVFAALVAIIPSSLSSYVVGLLTLTAITALPVVSVTMLFGYAGQITLGQAAFYGIGAYIYANLTVKQGLSPWIGLLAAVVSCAAFGYGLGRGLLRLRGYYLAMVTAAIGVIAAAGFSNIPALTGGYNGIPAVPPISLFGLTFDTLPHMFYLSVVVMVVVLAGVRLVARGEYGRVLRSIRESETASAAFGISIAHTKSQVLALSAALAAFGGCMFAMYQQYVSPDSFGMDFSISLFLGAVIGGLTSIGGAVFGAAYVVVLPELVSGNSNYEYVINGVITLVVLAFAPKGVIPLIGDGLRRLIPAGWGGQR